eukprot:5539274-Amphidinium_carterae.1
MFIFQLLWVRVKNRDSKMLLMLENMSNTMEATHSKNKNNTDHMHAKQSSVADAASPLLSTVPVQSMLERMRHL